MKQLKSILGINTLFIILLISVALPLRLVNLGYSEFQDDEKKALIRLVPNQTTINFLLEQRKGPMQFFVTSIPRALLQSYKNEAAIRLPFALINTGSVIVLYLLLYKITQNKLASAFGALLYLTNGFIVGFSRIAQYQSLNLLFSFCAMYFYSDLIYKKTHLIRSTLLGSFFWSLSFLSHWDAIWFGVPIFYYFTSFLFNKDYTSKYKMRVILYNFLLGCLMLLPFLLPYINIHTSNQASVAYFNKRFGISSYSLEQHKYIFELYNPFVTLPLYLSLICLATIHTLTNKSGKAEFAYVIWLIVNFLAIKFFMSKPGTHIYNYVLPGIFLCTFIIAHIQNYFSKYSKPFTVGFVFFVSSILFYQSYFLFVDHKNGEYPWEAKTIFNKTTTPYVNKEVLTFGFPHFRDLDNVNNFINAQEDKCIYYISNEGKEVIQIYFDINYGETKECYYILSIKKPFISTRDGVNFAQTKGKAPIYIYNARGKDVTKLYKIPAKPIKALNK